MFIAPIATILGLVLVLLVLVWAGQRRLMYFPLGNVPSPSEVGLPDAETVSFRTEDGLALQGWWVSAALRPTGVTVIVFNGNAGNRAARSSLAAALAARGIACLLFDYRGFGNNPGSPSEAGLALDTRAARAYAASRGDVDPDRLVYFGESLGAAVAVRLATHVPPRGLILRSPFSSMVDIGRHHYPYLPVRWLVRDRYPSLGYCQVDEKLIDLPPRYWPRARREPAILGIRNGHQPQLDNTLQPHRVAAIWRELVRRVQVALTHEDETPACHAGEAHSSESDLGAAAGVVRRDDLIGGQRHSEPARE